MHDPKHTLVKEKETKGVPFGAMHGFSKSIQFEKM